MKAVKKALMKVLLSVETMVEKKASSMDVLLVDPRDGSMAGPMVAKRDETLAELMASKMVDLKVERRVELKDLKMGLC